MGLDSITPYTKYMTEKGKGVFVLCRTSNPGAKDYEYEKLADGRHVYDLVGDKLSAMGKDYMLSLIHISFRQRAGPGIRCGRPPAPPPRPAPPAQSPCLCCQSGWFPAARPFPFRHTPSWPRGSKAGRRSLCVLRRSKRRRGGAPHTGRSRPARRTLRRKNAEKYSPQCPRPARFERTRPCLLYTSVCTLALLPLGLQYEVVDGFTALGLAKLALPLSLWRKAVYFAAVFALPAFFGADAVFRCV